MEFHKFVCWGDVLLHVDQGQALWYQAPLDARPVLLGRVHRRGAKVRVYPLSRDVDPFTADAGHLDRFRYPAS